MDAYYNAVKSIFAKLNITQVEPIENSHDDTDINELYDMDEVICKAEWFGTSWVCGVRDGRFVMSCFEPEVLAEELGDNLCRIIMENIKSYGLDFNRDKYKIAYAANGTFILSEKALKELSRNLPCWTPEEYQRDGKWQNLLPRHSDILIDMIEDLGDEASVSQDGESNKISIYETDYNEYVISVENGKEQVVTRGNPEWVSINIKDSYK